MSSVYRKKKLFLIDLIEAIAFQIESALNLGINGAVWSDWAFCKTMTTNFTTKRAQILATFWAILKHSFLWIKVPKGHFLGNFCKYWAMFYFNTPGHTEMESQIDS